jgi:phage-related minor tail protein
MPEEKTAVEELVIPETVNAVEVRKAATEASAMIQIVTDAVVTDITSCQFLEAISLECARREKRIDAEFKEAIDAADKAPKALRKLRARVKDPNTQVKQIADRKTIAWRQKEQLRLSEEREKQRLEQQKKDEEDRLKRAEEALDTNTPEGDALAERILEEPTFTPPPPAVELEKTAGISYTEKWNFEITDEKLIPRDYLIPDEKKIRTIVKAMKGATNIPGVRVFDEGTVIHR